MRSMAIPGILIALIAILVPAALQLAYAETANLSISVDMHLTGQTSAEGTFQAAGSIDDTGTASETFQIAADGRSVDGTKTLVGQHGSLTMHFSGPITPVAGKPNLLQVSGTWQAVSGTGAYTGASGGGQISTTLDTAAGTLHADYTGDLAFAAMAAGMPRTGAPLAPAGAEIAAWAAVAAIVLGAALVSLSRQTGRRASS